MDGYCRRGGSGARAEFKFRDGWRMEKTKERRHWSFGFWSLYDSSDDVMMMMWWEVGEYFFCRSNFLMVELMAELDCTQVLNVEKNINRRRVCCLTV